MKDRQAPAFLAWFLSGRWRAGSAVAASFAVAAWIPMLASPLLAICTALVILVVAQAGRRESLEVLGIATLGVVALTLSLSPWLGLAFALLAWLPGRLIGEVMLRRPDWQGVSWCIFGLAAILLVVVAWLVPLAKGPAFWAEALHRGLGALGGDIGPRGQQMVEYLARLMPGFMAALMVFLWVLAAVLGQRWWNLYRSAGDQRPFRQWVLPDAFPWLFYAVMAVAWFGTGQWGWFGENASLLLGALFAVQGLSLVHSWFAVRGWSWGWLLGVYALLLILAQAWLAVTLLGLADKVFGLRRRLAVGSL